MRKLILFSVIIGSILCSTFTISDAANMESKNKDAESIWNIAKEKIECNDPKIPMFPNKIEIKDKSMSNHIVEVNIPEVEVHVLQVYDGKKFVVKPGAYAITPNDNQPIIKAKVYKLNGTEKKEIAKFQTKGKAVIFEPNGNRILVVE